MRSEHSSTEHFFHGLEGTHKVITTFANPQSVLGEAALLVYDLIESTRHKEQAAQTESLQVIAQSPALDESEAATCSTLAESFNNDSPLLYSLPDSDDENASGTSWMSGEPFHGLHQANAAAQKFSEAVSEKLSGEEKKAADSIIHHANSFPERALQATYIGALLLAGAALTIFTHGFFSAQGGALIAEALDQLDNLAGNHPLQQHEEAFRAKNKNLAALLKARDEVEEGNIEKVNIAWIENIRRHCEAQKRTLEEIKTHLTKETTHHVHFISEINTLYKQYETQEKELKKITALKNKEATHAIRNIAFGIENIENRAIPTIEHVKNVLPPHAESLCNSFVKRAKNFYHANKDICKIIGLASLTALGIGLTIATGGIGGLLGAAALCVVANTGIKSIFQRAKKAVTNYINNSMLDKHAENLKIHCETQKKSLDKIADAINSVKNPVTKKEIIDTSLEHEKNIQALDDLKKSDDHEIFKLKKLIKISLSIAASDKKAEERLHMADGLLSHDAKQESVRFISRSKIVNEENEKTLHAIKKTTLAVVALTTLSIAVKGTGLLIAMGTAAISTAFSFAMKKITHFTKKCSQKIEKDTEGEGEKKTEGEKEGEKPHP